MTVAVDTHVHIYPHYRIELLLDAAHLNLRRAASDARQYAVCLTERAGHRAFRDLRDGVARAPGWSVAGTPEPHTLRAVADDGRELLIVAGRQIVSSERIEVLALGADLALPDGAPAAELLQRVRDAGALPVLPWGLGKWLGRRGARVRALIAEAGSGDFAVADTLLRPALAPAAPLLRAAHRQGLRVLAGTDPLPRNGEETVAGRYGVLVEDAPDAPRAEVSIVRLLADPAVPLRVIGRRSSLWETLSRMR